MNLINKASEITIKITRTTSENRKYKLVYTQNNWKNRNKKSGDSTKHRKRKLIIYCNHIMLTSGS